MQYTLDQKIVDEARRLKGEGKWTWTEIAVKLEVPFDQLMQNLKVREQELDALGRG